METMRTSYSGCLSDQRLQESCVQFVQSHYTGKGLVIEPRPLAVVDSRHYKWVEDEDFGGSGWVVAERDGYPFNFFGLIPYPTVGSALGREEQLVFDRTAGGCLVSLQVGDDSVLEVRDRIDGLDIRHSAPIALVLYILQSRYWMSIDVQDSDGLFRLIRKLVELLGLAPTFVEASRTLEECIAAFFGSLPAALPKIAQSYRPEYDYGSPLSELERSLAYPLSDLEWSTRTRRLLRLQGVRLLSELMDFSMEDLRSFGLTRPCLREVRKALANHGLCLKQPMEDLE